MTEKHSVGFIDPRELIVKYALDPLYKEPKFISSGEPCKDALSAFVYMSSGIYMS